VAPHSRLEALEKVPGSVPSAAFIVLTRCLVAGMHSRLYTRVLNKHWWSEACEGVALALSDTGLFGISSTCRESKKYFAQCAQVQSDATLIVTDGPDPMTRSR